MYPNLKRKFVFFIAALVASLWLFLSQNIEFSNSQIRYRTNNPFGYDYKVLRNPHFSEDFSMEEWRNISTSLHILDNMLLPSVGTVPLNTVDKLQNCVQKYSVKNLKPSVIAKGADPSLFQKDLWGNLTATRRIERRTTNPPQLIVEVIGITKVPLYIDKFYEKSGNLGYAKLGIDWLNTGLKISMNAFYLQKNKYESKQIAGVILHEIAHNMGFNHAVLAENPDFKQVEGNLTYEVGWCIGRNNDDKSPTALGLDGGSSSSTGFFIDAVSLPLGMPRPNFEGGALKFGNESEKKVSSFATGVVRGNGTEYYLSFNSSGSYCSFQNDVQRFMFGGYDDFDPTIPSVGPSSGFKGKCPWPNGFYKYQSNDQTLLYRLYGSQNSSFRVFHDAFKGNEADVYFNRYLIGDKYCQIKSVEQLNLYGISSKIREFPVPAGNLEWDVIYSGKKYLRRVPSTSDLFYGRTFTGNCSDP